MTTTKSWDFLNRLTAIQTRNAELQTLNSFTYGYNLANHRTNITLGPDNSRWAFTYDSLGQVISGKKYWADGTLFAGQQFEYTFDDIGNRKETKAGGDAAGANLRTAGYTNNLLNQITSRAVPGTNDIIGIAHASATVTVNGQSPYRKGEYYRTELAATNASGVAWQPVTNQAVLAGTTNKTTGNILTPPRVQQFWYDLDGNLLSDAVWTNTWDAENRLLSMVSRSDTPSTSWKSLTFGYDPQGRRISKVVSNWTGSAWSKVTDQRFVYDGWNLIAILDPQSTILQSFLWGLDLSGSMQGAGGVGGLLAVITSTNSNHFCAFDGNGNVAALIAATNGTESAHYEYGPFGELLRASGPMTKPNPVRFSTKFLDDDTDLLYYGYRFYSANTGRWLSRDPIGEKGGKNLCGFVANEAINLFDYRGLEPACCGCWPGVTMKCKVKYGPTYTPEGTIVGVYEGNMKRAHFRMFAAFEDDRSQGYCAGCCEARQYLTWTNGMPTPDHSGWVPAGDYSAGTEYEDRGDNGARYGHRSGPCHVDGYSGSYFPDTACGSSFLATDVPSVLLGVQGTYVFRLAIIDACNRGKEVASTKLTVIW
jgi:RHS repeat-associated protein